ncbi:MAG: TraB/GumN family protein [Candidatus Diapherotrites archaeon]|nr:TraB/GumN family protein [Candidatus Diapherotrites archaeon]
MTIEKIGDKNRKIILVGTAHISRGSIELVEKTIEKEKPDCVGVELDAQRYGQLKNQRKWRETNIMDVIKSGRIYLLLVNLLLANLQRRLGNKIGVKPGSEMLAAIRIAERKKIPVVLLDRDVRITLKRAFDLMSLWEKLKLGFGIVVGLFSGVEEKITKETIEELKNKDVITKLMEELSHEAPTIKRVLVDERDLYIANKILDARGRKIVAVVGAGHLQGIKKCLDRKRDISELEKVQKKKSLLRYLKYLVPALFVLFIAYGFFLKGIEASLYIFGIWFLITGIFSALGALFARSRLQSIIVAFLAAPFTTLHPALASGWFAAAMEAKYSMPKVEDFENLSNLNSYRDFEKNKVTHLLLVAAYTNLGSTIGVIIALPYILSMFA